MVKAPVFFFGGGGRHSLFQVGQVVCFNGVERIELSG